MVCFRGVTKMYASEQHAGDAAGMVWQLKCCARRVLHVQRVWDAAQQVLARQGALYIQRHCLQVQGPLQDTTFRESLVCYYTSPGGVYGSDDGRDSVLLDQLAHVLLVLLHLRVPVFHGALLNASIAVPCVPAGAAPCSRCNHIIMPTLDRGQAGQLPASLPLYLPDSFSLHSELFTDGLQGLAVIIPAAQNVRFPLGQVLCHSIFKGVVQFLGV